MNSLDPSKSEYSVSLWLQQAIDTYPEDDNAVIENLLRQIESVSDERGKVPIPLLIEGRLRLANILRGQGTYDKAIELYKILIKFVGNQDAGYQTTFSDKEHDNEKTIWCLAKAFIDYVDCGRFSSDLAIEQLLDVVENGIHWLEVLDRPDWAAGLQLERALLLTYQDNLLKALQEMDEALQKRQRCKDAPGYSLFTHKLEVAALLSSDLITSGNTEALTRAADLVSEIPLASASTLNEKRLACLILADVRQKQGEKVAVNIALQNAQKFANEIGQAANAENAHHLLSRISQDAGQMAKAFTELNQAFRSIKEKAELLDHALVQRIGAPTVLLTPKANSPQESNSTRHLSCYVSLPHFEEREELFYNKVLLPALKNILELKPYYWQVGY